MQLLIEVHRKACLEINLACEYKIRSPIAPGRANDPAPAQLNAWIELAELVSGTAFIENLRKNAKEVWGRAG
jgi:hypothetical protein